jgi:hypothetical protein
MEEIIQRGGQKTNMLFIFSNHLCSNRSSLVDSLKLFQEKEECHAEKRKQTFSRQLPPFALSQRNQNNKR